MRRWAFALVARRGLRANGKVLCEGPIIFEKDGRALNPRGRTGLRGRGVLGRFGPNHAIVLLLTRDHPVTGKLQIVVVQRKDQVLAHEKSARSVAGIARSSPETGGAGGNAGGNDDNACDTRNS